MDKLAPLLNGFDRDLLAPLLLMVAAVMVGVGALWSTLSERGRIKRRAQTVGGVDPGMQHGEKEGRSLDETSSKRAQKLLSYVAANFVPNDQTVVAQLKRQLMQAGFMKPSAVAAFFLARGAVAVGMALSTAAGLYLFVPSFAGPKLYLATGMSFIIGYFLPGVWLSRRIKSLAIQHRMGFPDFMDLMVVCADSGLAMEAALERVGREMAVTHPSLSANLTMATLEMRAGRTLGEALEHLGDRLGIDEARSFATLLQQSEELGSSRTEALRVYSDDMRHQRLMRAEEKAYALPSKLVIPMIIFIFPIVMVVVLLPVFIRYKYHVLTM